LIGRSESGKVVGADQSLGLLNQMLWAVLTIAAPVVAVVMIVGLIVSVLQVATQLQEMTLSYIPKLLAAVLVLIAVGPWMIERMTHFAVEAIRTIPSIG
jgi:flagellar biosynthetic protein FliQ